MPTTLMKRIEVVAAIICRDDQYFATQRGYGEFKDCSIYSGNLTLNEYENAIWLDRKELTSIAWLPADLKVVEAILQNNRI